MRKCINALLYSLCKFSLGKKHSLQEVHLVNNHEKVTQMLCDVFRNADNSQSVLSDVPKAEEVKGDLMKIVNKGSLTTGREGMKLSPKRSPYDKLPETPSRLSDKGNDRGTVDHGGMLWQGYDRPSSRQDKGHAGDRTSFDENRGNPSAMSSSSQDSGRPSVFSSSCRESEQRGDMTSYGKEGAREDYRRSMSYDDVKTRDIPDPSNTGQKAKGNLVIFDSD